MGSASWKYQGARCFYLNFQDFLIALLANEISRGARKFISHPQQKTYRNRDFSFGT